MRKEVMKKWVKALRSGKFKQGTGTLKQFNRRGQPQHCCLGVLCEVYNESMKKNKKKTLLETYDNSYGFDFKHGRSIFDKKKDDLPKKVKDWAGMKTSLGTFTIPTVNKHGEEDFEVECLADLNDTGRKFTTIADVIEKNYENL